jgi:putative transcriptional regulator
MENLTDLLHITYNNVYPQKGKVLISQPFMSDGCFKRSVVLLTEYSRDAAIGFVLNRPLLLTIDDLTDDFPSGESQLSIGGPVATNTLHYLHTFANIPEAIEVVNGIYWGGNIEVVRQLLSISVIKSQNIRFFLGYSGWSAGQLDSELKNNSWLVGDIRPAQIIRPSHNLWQESVKNAGEPYHLWTTFPENPGYN